jgi:C-terminal processing protease CtpA/Prc
MKEPEAPRKALSPIWQRIQKAVLIGRATAGALVSAQTFTVANGWRLFLPTAVSPGSDGRIFKDSPITPQHEVKWALDDFFDGRDPDIATALDVLLGKLPDAERVDKSGRRVRI